MDDIATCQYAVASLLCGSLVWFTCAGALSDKTQRFLPLSFCPFFFFGSIMQSANEKIERYIYELH